MNDAVLPAIADTGWVAQLRLQYACAGGRTVLVHKTHCGPLAVQKSLYPEGPAVCHTLVLHPPGGIAGGDVVDIGLELGVGSQVLVTTPGAGKWYRSRGAAAMQRLRLNVEAGAMLEWLPPETIVFNNAVAHLETAIDVADGGGYVGWEVLCLGRTASGEKFSSGEVRQATQISFAGAPVWNERCRLHGGSRLLDSSVGLAGAAVSALMLVIGKSIPADCLAQCRAVETVDRARIGISALPNVLAARYVGDSSEQAKRYFIALWRILRPLVAGRTAVPPRIWNT